MQQRDTEDTPASSGERLQRVLAARGVASRRKAEELIRAGRVSVDGRVVTELGTRVDPVRAAIRVDGKAVRRQEFRYVVLNKPSGFITTANDERGRRTVMELVPSRPRIVPVGRLDRDTEGLLLFTNDGDVANRVMHPRYELTKEYSVLTPTRPTESVMRKVRAGIEIDGKMVIPHEFRIVRETREGVVLSMVLHEGMNRVVRRMLSTVGIPVSRLRRERIGPLSVAGIPRGAHRDLSDGELASLREALRMDRDDGTAELGKAAMKSANRAQTRRGKPRRTPENP